MRCLTISLVLTLATVTATIAQQPALEAGQRVRVTVPVSEGNTLQHTYTFREVRGDTLVLSSAWYLLSDLSRLEVRRKRPGARGALLGMGVGAAGSALLAVAINESTDGNQPSAPIYAAIAGALLGALPGAGGRPVAVGSTIGFFGAAAIGAVVGVAGNSAGADLADRDAALIGGGVFGLIGYGVGTAIGYSRSRWIDVPPHSLRVSIVPKARGIGLGVGLAF